MRRKGMLLDNVLQLVISAIGLLLLLFVAYKIYSYNVNQDSENAKTTLDVVMGKIDALENGQSNSFLIQGVEGWYLMGWGEQDSSHPQKCLFYSCVCICEDNSAESCQENGFCREVKSPSVSIRSYYTHIDQYGRSNEAFHEYVRLPGNLLALDIQKDSLLLNITGPRAPEIRDIDYDRGPKL